MKRGASLLAIFFLLICNVARSDEGKLLKLGISFIPPADWIQTADTRTEEGITAHSFFYVSPDKQAVITLVSTQMSSTMFDEAIDHWTDQLGAPEKIKFLDVSCYIFSSQTNKDVARKIKQYHFFKNGKAYMINFLENAQTNDQYLPEFTKALNSFSVTE